MGEPPVFIADFRRLKFTHNGTHVKPRQHIRDLSGYFRRLCLGERPASPDRYARRAPDSLHTYEGGDGGRRGAMGSARPPLGWTMG